MRIKSYFAPSVQSAISIARREFGDDVTLVTSHTAALESRHLGDYEVVFAVEETPEAAQKGGSTQVIKAASLQQMPMPATESQSTAAVPAAVLDIPEEPTETSEPVVAATDSFDSAFQQALATPLSTEENLPEKLERVETLLVEMGIDGAMVRALMTMIERSAGAGVPASAVAAPVQAVVEPVVEEVMEEPAAAAVPDLTPAELAFYLSVSVGA